MKMNIEYLELEIADLREDVEAISNLVVDTMTIGEVSSYLKSLNKITTSLHLKELELEKVVKIVKNNTKIVDFEV